MRVLGGCHPVGMTPGPSTMKVTFRVLVAILGVSICAMSAGCDSGGGDSSDNVPVTNLPTCHWRVTVAGNPSPEKVNVVRCYLRFLATGNAAGLHAVAVCRRLSAKDWKHSSDVRLGSAVLTFPGDHSVDPSYTTVSVRYPNGVAQRVGMYDMADWGGPPGVWRMAIGSCF